MNHHFTISNKQLTKSSRKVSYPPLPRWDDPTLSFLARAASLCCWYLSGLSMYSCTASLHSSVSSQSGFGFPSLTTSLTSDLRCDMQLFIISFIHSLLITSPLGLNSLFIWSWIKFFFSKSSLSHFFEPHDQIESCTIVLCVHGFLCPHHPWLQPHSSLYTAGHVMVCERPKVS